MKYFALLFIIVFTSFRFWPTDFEEKAYVQNDENRSPEEELAGFKLPEGFIIELVASERDGVINPVQLTFDDSGRLWTQTAKMYPLDPIADIKWNDLLKLMNDPAAQKEHPNFKRMLDLYQGKTKGVDQILVLSNLYDEKGKTKTSVWADGLAIPMSILPYKEGVYVAQGSELFFLNDSNQDGRADQRTPLLTGFGFTDTHTMAHVLTRAPGGWIYFSHGALNKGVVTSFNSDLNQQMDYSKIARFSMDAKEMELVSSGLNNIWGFQLRGNGQWYGSEANDLSFSVTPMEPGTGFPGIGNERLRSYQPWMPELHKFRVGGTGISGLAFADDRSGSFPKEWRDVAFLANPITSTINAVRVVRNPDGTVSSEHLPDLVTSEDKFFRPVNMEFGPDGALYVADWYNKIISHNEIPTTHPDRDKSRGRIWRIRHVSQEARKIPNFYTMGTKDLVDQLKSESLWAKRAAWHQITDRPIQETKKLIPALISLINDESLEETTRIVALWSLEGLSHYDQKLVSALLTSKQPNLRREAVRSFASYSLHAGEVGSALKGMIDDANSMVRSQVLRTLSEIRKADDSTIDILVRASKPELPGNELGGAYERKFERYLALKALEEYPVELESYMNSVSASQRSASNLLWAIQALPKEKKEAFFFPLWERAKISELDESTFVWITKMLDNPRVYTLVKPILENPKDTQKYLKFYLTNQQQIQSDALSSLMTGSVKNLLKSTSESDQRLALEAIGRLNLNIPGSDIESLMKDQTSVAVVNLALAALDNQPEVNKAIFRKIIENENYDFDSRLSALHSFSKADPVVAFQVLQKWIPAFSMDQNRLVTSVLSGSNSGAGLLIKMYGENLINVQAFTMSSAERVFQAEPNNALSSMILEGVKKAEEDDKKAFHSKLNKFLAIAEKKTGDEKMGKAYFQTCLLCHRVGQEGLDIAPALDGSAARDNESLLTAVLNPDAAVEGGYAMYRVTKKDNSVVEGYLYNKDDKGVTISFMGGSQVFIQADDVKSQGFLGGRSFMPKGLIESYSDEQVADLLAYIRTLK